MRVLFLASEAAPFSKTGGLGDVMGALPSALAARGVDVLVATPLYASVSRQGLEPLAPRFRLRFPFGDEAGSLWRARLSPRHQVIFIEHEGFFGRRDLYGPNGGDYSDNHRRFAFFSIAALEAAQAVGWIPDVIHLNDWPTGLAAVALRRGYASTPLAKARSLFTIHNLAYQGLAPKTALAELGLPAELFTEEGLEFHGQASLLKAGLVFSDALTTVSPRYAQEICTPEGGWGLDGLLARRRASLHGILNGVDYREWDSGTDPLLPAHFDARKLEGKAVCKARLLERFGLGRGASETRPVFAMVSRFASQKGIELVLQGLPRVLEEQLLFVAIGSGEAHLQEGMRKLAAAHPSQVSVRVGFDEGLAHLVEAGADFFVMPSLYEPCGLNQMYSLRYGTVPVVRATGGLDDTVVDASLPNGTGIKFPAYSAEALSQALRRALGLYADRRKLAAVRLRGMQADFSWERAAGEYAEVYRKLSAAGGAQ